MLQFTANTSACGQCTLNVIGDTSVPSILNTSHFQGLCAITLAGLGLCFPTLATADPDTVVYDLQDKCGHRASEWFKGEYGNGITNTSESQILSNFRNHYNPQLNKCFVLLMSTAVNNKAAQQKYKIVSTEMQTLFDLNDNNEYGSFAQAGSLIMACYVQDKKCLNRAEWQLLLKPYLEQ
jgi:hypothetical protein